MNPWLTSLYTKLVELVLSWFAKMMSVFIKNEEMKIERAKQDNKDISSYKEAVASDKPHDEKVKDAESFLNNHHMPQPYRM